MKGRIASGSVILGGATLVGIAPFLPWAEVRLLTLVDRANGFETGDGNIAFATGLLIAIMGLVVVSFPSVPGRPLAVGAILATAVGGWLAWTNFADVPRFKAEIAQGFRGAAQGSMGPGLWALVAGLGLTALGAAMLFAMPEEHRDLASIEAPSIVAGSDASREWEPGIAPPAPGSGGAVAEPSALVCIDGHTMQASERVCSVCGKERWS